MTVIVVSGAPGTGKSTVASALADGLRWPLLTLDPVKEALADVLGLGTDAAGTATAGPAAESWSNRLGDAAAEIVFRLSGQFPDAVAEGWWRGDRRDRALAEFAGAIEVFCHCEPRLALDRMRARHSTGHHGPGHHGPGRHPVHRDVMNPAVLDQASMLAATVTPLGLGAALIRVDTGQPGGPARALAEVTRAHGLAGATTCRCRQTGDGTGC